MQNSCTDEASKHDENRHVANYDLRVLTICAELHECHYNQRELQYESQNDMHCNIETFLFLDLKNSLVKSDFLLLY
jgi:hypothetical protein